MILYEDQLGHPSSAAYLAYNSKVEELRAKRAQLTSLDEREDLAVLEDLYLCLTPEEQETADEEGWRSWPDLYDKMMEECLIETPFRGAGTKQVRCLRRQKAQSKERRGK